ncbi:MAG: type III secretion system chaperone [Chthoniobacterales bacterium]|nr:type III secretion system chaperone [Chthoniobacterales bacterium]
MATALSVSNSPFTELAGFLANRYQLPAEEIRPPLLELVIDSAVTLELQEEGSQIYLVGVVVEPLLIHEEYEAMYLLKVASSRLGLTEGTLSWDEEQKRIVFWLEVTSYTRETEFNNHLNLFLNHLDTWIKLVPPSPAAYSQIT